jgi:hypothetical protein
MRGLDAAWLLRRQNSAEQKKDDPPPLFPFFEFRFSFFFRF